jgi:hypothetical protein
MVDSKSIPAGSSVEHNEQPVPIGSQTQPSEPKGDKNRIISMALKSADCIGVNKTEEKRGKGVMCREQRSMREKSCDWIRSTC